VGGLKADYLDRPMGLENPLPQLSWRLESDKRNVRQTAYRVLVSRSEAALQAGNGDLWDSGRVQSRKSFGIRYQGERLASRQRCWWRVQVWDEREVATEPSIPSWWEMGLLDQKDWTAQWLAAEDSVAKTDRETGLHWIWGEPIHEKSTRRFRFKFHLPLASQGGECFAVVNDWLFSARISGIWIDGLPCRADPMKHASHMFDSTLDLPNFSAQWLTLAPMNAGDHLIAVEVNVHDVTSPITEGFTFFARLNLPGGEMLRIGSGSGWITHLKDGHEREDLWYLQRYDDREWAEARAVRLEDYQPWPAQPAMHLRREFLLEKPLLKARLYSTALGAYEARLNGVRVGDALLTPEISQYAKRVLYRVYDVIEMLKPGANALGLTVGDGWYASFDGRFGWGPPPRRVLAQLELTFVDGSRQMIATGPGWRTVQSPIQESEIRVGEIYDARLEQPGWDTAPFDDRHWPSAEIAARPPCRLVAQVSPPIRATQVLRPREILQPQPGVYVVDFGQNFAGWCRLHCQGSRGSRIELRFAELLTPAGEVNESFTDIGEPKRDVFILRGDATGETFEPHFTYRGFRYVQVTGLAVAPTERSVEGVVVHSDLQITGHLRSASPLIEQLWRNTLWSQRSNMVGIPTDCPSREQRGWMGDAGIFWDAAAFNMDVCAFTARHMDNVVDDQAASGAVPYATPEPRGGWNDPLIAVWSDAAIILPWTVWRRYGDVSIIERNWKAMNRYLQFILDHNPDYLWNKPDRLWNGVSYAGIGDAQSLDQVDEKDSVGIPVPSTPKNLIATAYWAHSATLLSQMADAIGRSKEAELLRGLFEKISQAFNTAFVQPNGIVGEGSQTGYILALQFGLLPQAMRPSAAERLAAEIRSRGVALTSGVVGTQFSLDVLADTGFADLVYGLLLRTAYPSWGDMIKKGATTLWETWNGEGRVNGEIRKMSQNHYWFGSICGFLFRRMAGIDAAEPGFEKISIRPIIDGRVNSGGGDYDSIMGPISTDWVQSANGRFALNVNISANATASIHLPARSDSRISEGRRSILDRTDLRIASRLANEVVIEVGSGTYQFAVDG